jgi:hypothetical protein
MQGPATSGTEMMVRTFVGGILFVCVIGAPWMILRKRKSN